MNCLVLFVAISAVLVNSAYGISLRTKINAVTMKAVTMKKAIAGSWNSVETYSIGWKKRSACTCTCPNGESFSMVGWNDCENGHGKQSCWRGRHRNLKKVKCASHQIIAIIEELQKKNKDLTEEKNLLIKQKIKLKRKILDLAEASKPKDVFGMVCGPEQKRRQNACFKHLEKCGDNAILSWPIEWHQIHEHFDAKIHHLSNKNETHIGHPHLAKRRRLLEYSGVTDLIDLSKLEYVQSTETDTLYRFNCFGEDKHIRLCELMSETVETCDCSKRDSIPFRYEGEEVYNNNKYSNAVITGRLECENGAYAIHMEVDITENGVSLGRVDRRRRLLNSKRGRSRLLGSSQSQC